jgi:hypothetical protein
MGSPLDRDRVAAGYGGVDLVGLKPCLSGKQAEHIRQIFRIKAVVQLVQHGLAQQGGGGEKVVLR